MLLKFLPFERKYVFVGAVWRHNAPREATRATVFSSRPHTMRDVMIPLVVPLKAATEPVGDITIGYDPPRTGRVIPLAIHDEKAREDIEDGGS